MRYVTSPDTGGLHEHLWSTLTQTRVLTVDVAEGRYCTAVTERLRVYQSAGLIKNVESLINVAWLMCKVAW